MRVIGNIMTDKAFTSIIITAKYLSFIICVVLFILILKQIFKRDLQGLKISFLYLLNTIVFVLAYGFFGGLAIIVGSPIRQTKEKSIASLRSYTDGAFGDFLLYSTITIFILTILNIFYLKYFVKFNILKHSLILVIAETSILLLAAYVSTEWYFTGRLQEIYLHFKRGNDSISKTFKINRTNYSRLFPNP